MIFRVPACALRASAGMGAERLRRRSVHKVHDCGENREGNNPENSAVVGIYESRWDCGRYYKTT
ncbi:MAG: hypothetical protein U1E78_04870 [Gammaproteobacteria bacterium]